MKRKALKRLKENDEQPEMDIDDDEQKDKIESADDSSEAEEEEERQESEGSTFLDSFYGLSSVDPQIRAAAARDLIQFSLIGSNANLDDATYAFKRLLNGLCSGRASARQGNASALATFLKIAQSKGTLKEIQQQSNILTDKEMTLLAFVRHRLLTATQPGDGKRKGSEDRDYKFGRLFGILAVIRSGLMLPVGDDRLELSDILETAVDFCKDLATLYVYKRWMREPAAHAIGMLLNSFYAVCSIDADAVKVVDHLVVEIVVPEFFQNGDNSSTDSKSTAVLSSYSAEQIAMALNIQTHVHLHSKALPAPINKPILTVENLAVTAAALSETSVVTQPRTHLVWDAFTSFITESLGTRKNVEVRKLREGCPIGSDIVHDLVGAVIRHVVVGRLLGMDTSEENNSVKTTHERSALALCLVRNFAGAEFLSSITGRTKTEITPDLLETVVFTPIVVKSLFLGILSKGESKKQAPHLLRPLALQVLETIVKDLPADGFAMRLALARSLLTSDPRFDSKTKTTVVSSLVKVGYDVEKPHAELWGPYLAFLEKQIARTADTEMDEKVDTISSYVSQGYADLLFQFGKTNLRVLSDEKDDKIRALDTSNILGFLATAAFFDLSGLKDVKLQLPKKKKKGKKEDYRDPMVEAAIWFKSCRSNIKGLLPYQIRSALSSRFFSLLAESIAVAVHSSSDDRHESILTMISNLTHSLDCLEAAGATKLRPDIEDDTTGAGSESTGSTIRKIQDQAKTASKDPLRKRFVISSSILASALYLNLLDCGSSSNLEEDDLDADEDDTEEVRTFIDDLESLVHLFLDNKDDTRRSKVGDEDGDDPLTALAAFCANILSSPISTGSQSKGGFPRLIKDVVKMMWTSGLTLESSVVKDSTLDPRAMDILLGCIGAETRDQLEQNGDDDSMNDEDDGTEDGSEDPGVFSKISQLSDVVDDNESSDKEGAEGKDGHIEGVASDDEVVLNADRLHAFLDDDSDDGIDAEELEHHEGADSALAKLIKMKQDARKAGQMARERLEVSQQLRCLTLLETLMIGKSGGWGPLVRTDTVLQTILPILRYRRDLENSLTKSSAKATDPGACEKQALVDRLSSLLKTKVFKTKLSDRLWNSSVDGNTLCSDLSAQLFAEMKCRISKDQRACCSAALAFVVRAVPESGQKLEVANIYQDILAEWATKRTTRVDVSILEDFINSNPVIAQALLAKPLADATSSARSPFLKAESFRLMSSLFNSNLNPRKTDFEKASFLRFEEGVDHVVKSFALALKDAEMCKLKRLREVLKAFDKVLVFATSDSGPTFSIKQLHSVTELLEKLKDGTENGSIGSLCIKLLKMAEQKGLPDEPNPSTEDDGDENATGSSTQKAKKNKKKKSKKKR
jgi:hypothetical protein